MSFYNNFVEKKNVFGICEKFVCIHFNGNGQQFECEWMRIYFRFPLPLTRRQSWNKSDTTQCMLHVKQTTLSFRFPVWKRVERLVQCKPLFLGFLCFFKHSTWRRPTPLRALATSGCNQVCLEIRMVAERLCSTRSVIRRDVARK